MILSQCYYKRLLIMAFYFNRFSCFHQKGIKKMQKEEKMSENSKKDYLDKLVEMHNLFVFSFNF